jgi:hypothetical protein
MTSLLSRSWLIRSILNGGRPTDANSNNCFARSRSSPCPNVRVSLKSGKEHRGPGSASLSAHTTNDPPLCGHATYFFHKRPMADAVDGLGAPIVTELVSRRPERTVFTRFSSPATTINKTRYSAFAELQLLQHLQAREADGLIVGGSETDVCVFGNNPGRSRPRLPRHCCSRCRLQLVRRRP